MNRKGIFKNEKKKILDMDHRHTCLYTLCPKTFPINPTWMVHNTVSPNRSRFSNVYQPAYFMAFMEVTI